jgi:hypothetical protein
MNKEQVYDEQIDPLMARVIATCKDRRIACFATFDISAGDGECRMCTTCLGDGSGVLPEAIQACKDIVYGPGPFPAKREGNSG